MGEKAAAENALSGTLKTLFAVAEAYPDLKANENFLKLQEELSATENRIGFSRQHYNDVVSNYNTRLQSFPANVVGGTLEALAAIVAGPARRAFIPIGGLHHAARDGAAGLCGFHDIGVAIGEARRK